MKQTKLTLLHVLTLLLCAVFVWSGAAAADSIEAGKQYTVHSPAQPTATGKNIEVLEFFSYGCPHCKDLEPVLEPWIKKLPADVTFRRVPVVFSESWAPYAKIYFAAEALGLTEKLHAAAFKAVHVERVNVADDKSLQSWVSKQGVDGTKFMEMYNSFGLAAKTQESKAIVRRYGISGVPTLIVDGKYETSASLAGGHNEILPVLDELIKKARAERAGKN